MAKVAKGTAKVAKGTAKVAKGTAKVAKGTAKVAEGMAKVAQGTAKVAEGMAKEDEGMAKVAGRLTTLAMPMTTFAVPMTTFAMPRADLHPRVLPFAESQANTMTPPAKLLLGTTFFQLALAALLFGVAGTLAFWQAWVYLGIYFVTGEATNLYLIYVDPALLVRRLKRNQGGETEPLQRVFQALVGPFFLGMLTVAALDHRFGWSLVPLAVTGAGLALAAASYVLVFFVFRENTFASSVIEVDPAQRVVATGPYRLVRHPMYTGAVLGGLATPVALGSYWAEVFFVPIVAIMVMRILGEERFLREKLPGYSEYTGKTRHRLVPGAW